MNNDIDMVKAIAFRKRIKYAGDIAEQLMLAGWDLHTAILFVENLPDAEGEDDYDLSKDALLAREKSKDALVKHGRWREWNNDGYHHYTCSVCKHNVKSPGRFCPNCGARMDGGDEDVER